MALDEVIADTLHWLIETNKFVSEAERAARHETLDEAVAAAQPPPGQGTPETGPVPVTGPTPPETHGIAPLNPGDYYSGGAADA